MNSKIKIIIVFIVLVLISLIFFTPINLPYKIESAAKILPARQWILSRNANNDVLTSSINNLNGISNSYALTSFERGESMVISISDNLQNGQFVNVGDTLAIIYSSNQQEKLIELKGQLQVLKAKLASGMSGVKNTEIKEFRERLELAKSEYEKQKKIVDRKRKLFDKNLIAEEEYQKSLDELKILEKAIDVRKAELESAVTGLKTEEINYLQKQITSVENKIKFINSEIDKKNFITVPFNGRLERNFSIDTLVVISNFDFAIAVIPISIEESEYLNEGDKISLWLNNFKSSLRGVIQSKQSIMRIINGKQCIMVLATIYDIPKNIITGVILPTELDCGNIPLLSYLERKIVL